ncbi:hypothetical protein PV04_07142 [Phialophora macrospora]|uniref:Uncharacterized protein n=1 Tax=Phialophora macrospora TaxID=1851006 RepID=A0A0D2CHZ1_9EURO|nr:hypothetical protein PV04_07142 [Phialophora macrospora]
MNAGNRTTDKKDNEASQAVTTTLAMVASSDSGSIVKQTEADFKHVESGPAHAICETYRQAGLTEEDAEFLSRFTAKEERAIYRKLNRASIGMLPSGYLSHPPADISDYNVAVSVFFIPYYILCEIPSDILW